MQPSHLRRRAAVVALGALTVASVSYAVAASGASPAEPASYCRASLLKASIAGNALPELVVANPDGTACATDSQGVGTLIDDPVFLKILYAETAKTAPQARAGVAEVVIPLSTLDPQLPDISAQVLTARASASCHNGALSKTGSSRVVGLQIGENGLVLPPEDEETIIDQASPLVRIALNEQTESGGILTQRALHVTALVGTPAEIDVIVSEAQVGATGNPCTTTTTQPPTTQPPTSGPPSPGPQAVGWMNGGGQVGPKEIQHAFVLPCTLAQERPGPNLTVEVPNGGRFKLAQLTEVSCTMDPAQGLPEQPEAAFNTLTGKGIGTCGKSKTVDISFTFTDEGEPAAGRDTSSITVGDGSGPDPCDLSISGTLNGNHQAHRGTNPPA